MSPEQRQYVQRSLLPKWQQMSPERKQVVTGRLHTLQGMTPASRQKALNDPQFMHGLNPDEQSVLRGLDSCAILPTRNLAAATPLCVLGIGKFGASVDCYKTFSFFFSDRAS